MNGKITLFLIGLSAAILVIVAGCAAPGPTTPTPTPTPPMTTASPTLTTAPPTIPLGPVTIDLVAQNIAFDTDEISVPACAEVTMNFDNLDPGIPHNFALYTNSQATETLFKGEIITGAESIQYTFTAPCTPGDYYFRCDVHPSMDGTFRVT
ncbi:MAG: cupredoxin domain-containing protein [Methanomicrobiaceae archaeon]|nr:cupredoxin domain-containing protein [Methanomicrobiaceae archaeon]